MNPAYDYMTRTIAVIGAAARRELRDDLAHLKSIGYHDCPLAEQMRQALEFDNADLLAALSDWSAAHCEQRQAQRDELKAQIDAAYAVLEGTSYEGDTVAELVADLYQSHLAALEAWEQSEEMPEGYIALKYKGRWLWRDEHGDSDDRFDSRSDALLAAREDVRRNHERATRDQGGE